MSEQNTWDDMGCYIERELPKTEIQEIDVMLRDIRLEKVRLLGLELELTLRRMKLVGEPLCRSVMPVQTEVL